MLSQSLRWLLRIAFILLIIFALLLLSRVWLFNSIVNSYANDLGIEVELNGSIQVSLLQRGITLIDLRLRQPSQGLNIHVDSVDVTLDSLNIAGTSTLSHMQLEEVDVATSLGAMRLRNISARDATYDAAAGYVSLEGLSIEGLDTDIVAKAYVARIEIKTAGVSLETMKGEVASLNIENVLIDQAPLAVSAARISFIDLGLSLEQVLVAQVLLDTFQLGVEDAETSLLAWTQFSADVVTAAPHSLDIEAVRFSEPKVSVIRSPTGELLLPLPLIPEDDNSATTPSQPFSYNIDTVLLTDGLIHIRDQAVEPAYIQDYHLEKLKLTGVNPIQNVPWELILRQADAGQIGLDGQLSLASLADSATLNGKIEHLELPELSGYLASSLGYGIKTGQLNAQLTFTVVDQKLDGELDLRLISPDFVVLDEERASEFDGRTGMPLPMALSLLEDSDGHISLNLPVSGDLANPKFNVSGVLQVVASKALNAAAMHYLKSVVFPQGTLLSLAGMVGGSIYDNFTSSPVVLFNVSDTALTPEGMLVLDNVKKLLVEKNSLSMKLCSVTFPGDGQNDSLEEMAAIRTAAVRDYLLADKLIEPQRLLQCLGRNDPAATQGRVDISF